MTHPTTPPASPGTRTIKARYLKPGATVVVPAEPHPVTSVRRDDSGDVLATVEVRYHAEEGVTVTGEAPGAPVDALLAVQRLQHAVALMAVRYADAREDYIHALSCSKQVRSRHLDRANRRLGALVRLTAALGRLATAGSTR